MPIILPTYRPRGLNADRYSRPPLTSTPWDPSIAGRWPGMAAFAPEAGAAPLALRYEQPAFVSSTSSSTDATAASTGAGPTGSSSESSSSSSSSSGPRDTSTGGPSAGVVVGAVAALGVLGAGLYLARRRTRRRRR